MAYVTRDKDKKKIPPLNKGSLYNLFDQDPGEFLIEEADLINLADRCIEWNVQPRGDWGNVLEKIVERCPARKVWVYACATVKSGAMRIKVANKAHARVVNEVVGNPALPSAFDFALFKLHADICAKNNLTLLGRDTTMEILYSHSVLEGMWATGRERKELIKNGGPFLVADGEETMGLIPLIRAALEEYKKKDGFGREFWNRLFRRYSDDCLSAVLYATALEFGKETWGDGESPALAFHWQQREEEFIHYALDGKIPSHIESTFFDMFTLDTGHEPQGVRFLIPCLANIMPSMVVESLKNTRLSDGGQAWCVLEKIFQGGNMETILKTLHMLEESNVRIGRDIGTLVTAPLVSRGMYADVVFEASSRFDGIGCMLSLENPAPARTCETGWGTVELIDDVAIANQVIDKLKQLGKGAETLFRFWINTSSRVPRGVYSAELVVDFLMENEDAYFTTIQERENLWLTVLRSGSPETLRKLLQAMKNNKNGADEIELLVSYFLHLSGPEEKRSARGAVEIARLQEKRVVLAQELMDAPLSSDLLLAVMRSSLRAEVLKIARVKDDDLPSNFERGTPSGMALRDTLTVWSF